MQFTTDMITPTQAQTDCLVIGLFTQQALHNTAKIIDEVTHGHLSKLLKLGDFKGKIEETFLLPAISGIPAKRILIVGCGENLEITESNYQKIIVSCITKLKTTQARDACLFLTELNIANRDQAWKIRYSCQIINAQCYIFDQFKSKAQDKSALENIIFSIGNDKEKHLADKAIFEANAVNIGINFTKDLGNTPANVCTPTYLAEQSALLAQSYKELTVTVLDEEEMCKLGMNTILAVSQGSREPAKLITLEYHGAKEQEPPVVFVGKGITFDTGGIWLKPPENMDEMKFDMSGAGTVLGIIKAICEMKLAINVVGIIASAENMPSGTAIKPGDIVKSLSGQTVEIINTDAEGRLVLCDALTYSEKFKPAVVIDIATLTGAIIIALGPYAAGVFGNNQQLIDDLMVASNQSQDFLWPMPMIEEYQARLDSNFADMKNVTGDRVASSVIAACFLGRFTKGLIWAHLDIAAVAYKTGNEKGATGRPVALLMQYLMNRVQE